MCGIVGYIGKKDAQDIIMDGINTLEYRGYDSAGISVIDGNKIVTQKKAGRISVLQSILNKNPIKGHVGIGHTRWATHGVPTDVNAHPHLDDKKEFAIVHNGILENYIEIKDELLKKGDVFLSETDSEVIAHLIAHVYNGDLLKSSMEMMKSMRGAYSLGIISSKESDTLIGIKKRSPLVVGISDFGYFIASDVSAMIKFTKKVIYLKEGDIVKLTPDSYEIWNDERRVEREISTIEWDIEASTKGGYEHFMLKEINEQPNAVLETISHRIENNRVKFGEDFFSKEELKEIEKIKIIGCGTAYHAALSGKTALDKILGIPTTVEIASEFNYSNPKIDEKTLAIFVSQSGETSDTMTAIEIAKENRAKTLAITNVVGSTISRAADKVLYTWAGPEISVASTKAYTTQLALMYLISIDFAKKLDKIDEKTEEILCRELLNISDELQRFLDKSKDIDWKELAKLFLKKPSAFYLGRQSDFNCAKEGALKLKELSYIHAEALPAGELKHGPLSLIEEDVPVVIIATQKEINEKTLSNLKEVKSRGAVTIVITDEDTEVFDENSITIKVPVNNEIFMPALIAIPMQLLAYYVAYIKGNNVDKPRNLAKSVTVE